MSSSSTTTKLASGKLILDEPSENVLRIRISNPDKRGALDHEILDTLAETLWTADSRCVIITGDGVFSAGYDIGNLEEDERLISEAAEKLVAHPFTDAIRAPGSPRRRATTTWTRSAAGACTSPSTSRTAGAPTKGPPTSGSRST